MIQHWDGRRWQIVPQPGAGLPQPVLYSVAGTPADDVWAAGGYVAADGASPSLVEHWDGTGWTSQTVSTDPSYSNIYFGLGGPRPGSGRARPGSGNLWLAGYQDTDSVLAGGRVQENLVAQGCGG
jgi:hypothetical protein